MIARWAPAAAWAYLLFGRGRFWEAKAELPGGPGEPKRWPPVTVVVPARDEAALLPHTLPALLAQDYPGHAQVVLVDDQSSDGTGELARALARTSPDARLGLTVLKGRPRPSGWAGKPWAMAQGVERALAAPVAPEWVLFSDADIAHPPGSLRRLVASAVAGDKPAVSVMARLATQSRWERLTMPLFVYFFAQIYPFRWVNDPERATAAAAGGCFLVNAEALEEVGGVAAFADATIDDVALAKALSAAGFDLWLTLAGGSGGSGPGQAPCIKSLRHYPRLADIWAMVARSAYTQLGCKPAALAGAMAALSFVYLSPPLLCAIGLVAAKPLTTLAGLAAWTAMTASYLPLARYYKVSPASALALPFTCSLYMAMTLDSARRHRLGTTGWKGRPTALA